MNLLPRPDVILTHESDLDGLLSGLLLHRLARHLFQADLRLEAWNYTGWKTRQMREKSAWVADLTFEPRLDSPDWVVVDHHATEAVPRRARLIHDTTKSASLLCHELCREHGLANEGLERLVHLSNVADLYLADDPDFSEAVDYANLVKTYGFWSLHALIGGDPVKLIEHPLLEVVRAKRRVEDPLGYEWTRARVHRLSDTVGYAETVVGDVNAIVHQLLRDPGVPYHVIVSMYVKANRTVLASFRSRGGEALAVARQFQGGGHANASGATLPRSVSSLEEAVLYLQQVLNPAPVRGQGLGSLESAFAGLKLE